MRVSYIWMTTSQAGAGYRDDSFKSSSERSLSWLPWPRCTPEVHIHPWNTRKTSSKMFGAVCNTHSILPINLSKIIQQTRLEFRPNKYQSSIKSHKSILKKLVTLMLMYNYNGNTACYPSCTALKHLQFSSIPWHLEATKRTLSAHCVVAVHPDKGRDYYNVTWC